MTMSANPKYDTIIVGAGHNGLVAANYLAKAGRKVLVLERRDRAGGQLAGETFDGAAFDVRRTELAGTYRALLEQNGLSVTELIKGLSAG